MCSTLQSTSVVRKLCHFFMSKWSCQDHVAARNYCVLDFHLFAVITKTEVLLWWWCFRGSPYHHMLRQMTSHSFLCSSYTDLAFAFMIQCFSIYSTSLGTTHKNYDMLSLPCSDPSIKLVLVLHCILQIWYFPVDPQSVISWLRTSFIWHTVPEEFVPFPLLNYSVSHVCWDIWTGYGLPTIALHYLICPRTFWICYINLDSMFVGPCIIRIF
jgi:hypothetical protein